MADGQAGGSSGGEEEQEEVLQLSGCQDLRMSGLAWAHQSTGQSQGKQEVETWRNVPYKSCDIVDRQHHRITHLAMLVGWAGPKQIAYLTFLPGVHSTCTCRSWAWRRNEPLLHLTNYQLGRSFLLWC